MPKRKASCLDDYGSGPINKIYADCHKLDMKVSKLKKKLGHYTEFDKIKKHFENIKKRKETLLPKKFEDANMHYKSLNDEPNQYWEKYTALVKSCKNINKVVIQRGIKDCMEIEEKYSVIQNNNRIRLFVSDSRLLSSGADSEE